MLATTLTLAEVAVGQTTSSRQLQGPDEADEADESGESHSWFVQIELAKLPPRRVQSSLVEHWTRSDCTQELHPQTSDKARLVKRDKPARNPMGDRNRASEIQDDDLA